MKKLLFSLIVCSLFGLFSCQKEEAVLENTPNQDIESRNLYPINDRVSIEDGRLVFPNPTVFDEFVNSLLDVNIDSLLATIPPSIYQSLYNRTGVLIDGEELDVPELETVLNQYGIVEIDDLLYRLDFGKQKVYVLPISAGSNSIQQFRAADDCIEFPDLTLVSDFDSEIFSAVYRNTDSDNDDLGGIVYPWPGTGGSDDCDDDPQALGKCEAAPSGDDDSDLNPRCFLEGPERFGVGNTRVRYFKAGIYFRLTARFTLDLIDDKIPPECEDVPHTLTYNASWNRCGPGGVGADNGLRSDNGCRTLVSFYSGTRRLRRYSLSASSTWNCDGQTISTGTAAISGN